MEEYSDTDFSDSDSTNTVAFGIKTDEILHGESSKYQIQKFLGKGAFGKVAQCVKLDTNEKVAVKIVEEKSDGILEMLMSQEIRKLDPDKNNLVRLIERFQYRGHICLALEMLDVSIRDYMIDRKYKPLHISEIQTIASQVLVALNSLKSIGVVHTDISINNIMLVNHQLQPFKVKLVDFGSARPLWLLRELRGEMMQPVLYRAPEVILGLELNEALDMWSFGCALTFMYLGKRAFPQTEMEVISIIVKSQGQPSDHLLDSGIFTNIFFQKCNNSHGSSWKLIRQGVTEAADEDKFIIDHPELKHIFECEDTQAFLWLLKQMLNVDPEKRINPSEALKSHFIAKQSICRSINLTENLPLLYFFKMLWQLEALSAVFKSNVESREAGPQIDDPCLGDKKRCCINNEPSATAGLNEVGTVASNYEIPSERNAADHKGRSPCKTESDQTTAETTGEPQYLNGIASPVSARRNSDACIHEGTTGFVKSKTKKRYWKEIHKFFTDHQESERSGKIDLEDPVAAETDQKQLGSFTI